MSDREAEQARTIEEVMQQLQVLTAKGYSFEIQARPYPCAEYGREHELVTLYQVSIKDVEGDEVSTGGYEGDLVWAIEEALSPINSKARDEGLAIAEKIKARLDAERQALPDSF